MVHLIEYYKFHNEIPRIFCSEIFELFFDYHDMKRQLNFEVVTKKLQVEKGEDPYKELKEELKRKRNIRYKPMLTGMSTLNTRRMKDDGNSNSNLNNLSRTLEDIYRNLNNIKFTEDSTVKKINEITFELSKDYEINPVKTPTIVNLGPDILYDFSKKSRG